LNIVNKTKHLVLHMFCQKIFSLRYLKLDFMWPLQLISEKKKKNLPRQQSLAAIFVYKL